VHCYVKGSFILYINFYLPLLAAQISLREIHVLCLILCDLMNDIPLCFINNHGRVKTLSYTTVIYCTSLCCLQHATCLGPNSHFQDVCRKPDDGPLGLKHVECCK